MSSNFALELFMSNRMGGGGGGGFDTGSLAGSGNGLLTTPVASFLSDMNLFGNMQNKVQPAAGLTFYKLLSGLQGATSIVNLQAFSLNQLFKAPASPLGIDFNRNIVTVFSPGKQ